VVFVSQADVRIVPQTRLGPLPSTYYFHFIIHWLSHSAPCSLSCWHCYVSYVSSEQHFWYAVVWRTKINVVALESKRKSVVSVRAWNPCCSQCTSNCEAGKSVAHLELGAIFYSIFLSERSLCLRTRLKDPVCCASMCEDVRGNRCSWICACSEGNACISYHGAWAVWSSSK
jgi:hypothetical protein